MSSRYNNGKIIKKRSTNWTRQLNTAIYGSVPETADDIYVTTQEGDRLDNLANQFYGSPDFWWYIASINNISTMNLEAGTSLRIPPLTEAARGVKY